MLKEQRLTKQNSSEGHITDLFPQEGKKIHEGHKCAIEALVQQALGGDKPIPSDLFTKIRLASDW